MMGLDCGGNGVGVNSSSSTSNLSASAPPFTVDRSNPNPNPNSLVHYPQSSYGVEPFNHSWKYSSPSSHKPELDIRSARTTSYPSSDDYRLSAAVSGSPSPTHWAAFTRDAETSGSTLAYGGGIESYYTPLVPPMVEKDSPLVDNMTAYTRGVFDQNYMPEWMHRLDFINGQQSKRVEFEGGIFGKEKIGDMSSQIDYMRCTIGREYLPLKMDSLDMNGMQNRRVEPDGSCSSDMANVGDVSAQFDYTQRVFNREYKAQQMDSLNVNGYPYKSIELDENFYSQKEEVGCSYIYTNPVKEGYRTEFGDKSGEIYERSNRVTDRTAHTGIFTVGDMGNKLHFEQNPSFLVSGSTYPETHPLTISHEGHKSFFNFKSSCSPYERSGRLDNSAFSSSISVTRSSPTVIVTPPPTNPDILEQSNGSRKSVQNDNAAGSCSVFFDRTIPSNQKNADPKSSSDIKEGSLATNFSKQCDGGGFLSSSTVKELTSSLHANDTCNGKIEETFGSQISNSNFSCELPMADETVQVINSNEDSSDFIDHHNPAVDSPCWKGAPSSQFSPFDVEVGDSHDFLGNLNENHGFYGVKHKHFHLLDDPTRDFSTKAGQIDKNDENKSVSKVLLPSECILDGILPTKDVPSKGVLTEDAYKMPRIDSDCHKNLHCGSHTKIYDSKHFCSEEKVRIDLNDVSESSGAVAFHVMEKVLASPSSQEDATEHVKLQPDSIKTTIKRMHDFSEMFLSHLSHDGCALEEDDIVALKCTITNLNTAMSGKMVQPRDKRKPADSMEHIFEKFGEHHDMDGERAEKSLVFASLRNARDTRRDDGMAKAIKKVLEENFLYNEEMDSQANLFKSLWLEAEAALCSINYKARFDQLKIEMEQTKAKSSKVQDDDDDDGNSITCQFNILKSRKGNLGSTDKKTEQQSKALVRDQLEGEALNMLALKPYFVHQAMPLNEENKSDLSIADYGYELGNPYPNTSVPRQYDRS